MSPPSRRRLPPAHGRLHAGRLRPPSTTKLLPSSQPAHFLHAPSTPAPSTAPPPAVRLHLLTAKLRPPSPPRPLATSSQHATSTSTPASSSLSTRNTQRPAASPPTQQASPPATPPPDGNLPPEEIMPTTPSSLFLGNQMVEPMSNGVDPSTVHPLSAEHQMDAFAAVLTLVQSKMSAVAASKDEDVTSEALEPSLFKPTVVIGVGQESIGLVVVEKTENRAATKLQKVYRSYRTRRRLADSAVIAEELWWQAMDFARLNHSTVSFFNYSKPETAISRWNRVSMNASKVGQGLSKDGKALKLAFQHWIEAIDPRHRYGHNLHLYYEKWCESEAGEPFFYWLDLGEGRNVELKECQRSLLRQQCIKYLGPQEREHYEYTLLEGKFMHKQTGDPLDTTKGSEGTKWIFVMSTSRRLYAGMKKKGLFHHSSFLAGGSTIAAGRFTTKNGVLKAIWAYSGHYKPSDENLNQFLDYLRENGVDLNEVQIRSSDNEDYSDDTKKHQAQAEEMVDALSISKRQPLLIPTRMFIEQPIQSSINIEAEEKESKVYRRTLSGGLKSQKTEVSQKAILERIKSKKELSSYQLGQQVSSKWCSGAGPRIGCVADYPAELRMQALEFTNLSPRRPPTPHSSQVSCLPPSPLGSQQFALCPSSTLQDY